MGNINNQIGLAKRTCFAGAQGIGMRGRCPVNQQGRFADILHDRLCNYARSLVLLQLTLEFTSELHSLVKTLDAPV